MAAPTRPNPGDDSAPHSGEGGPRRTPAQLTVDPAFTGTYVPQRTPSVVLFGDSRTADCAFIDSTHQNITNLSWWDMGQARCSGGPVFTVPANAGVGGNTTAQMLARFDTDVTPYAPMAMTLWGGINDTWATTTDVDASVANIAAILAKAKAQGIFVFLITETPSSSKGATFNSLLPYYNDRLRYLAATLSGVELWDFYGLIVDPTSNTGAPKANWLRDGLHLNALSASTLGTYVGGKLAHWPFRLVTLPASLLDSQGVTANSRNVISNPLMTGTGGTLDGASSGTLPSNWTASGTPTAVCSAPSRSDGYGNDLQAAVTAAAAGSKFFTNTISTSRLVSGTTYVLEAAVGITSPSALYRVSLEVQVTISGTTYFYAWGAQAQAFVAGDAGLTAANGIIRSRPFTLPAGTVTAGSLVVAVNFGAAGSATVNLGRVSLKAVA